MPKDKKCRPKLHPYSKEDLGKSLDAVRAGATLGQAAKKFNVPKSTIHNKITGKYPEGCQMGKPTTLSREMEAELVEWILGCAEKWHPITMDQMLDSVQLMCKHEKIPNKFTNDRPGYVWYKSFLRRHPELRQRTAEIYSIERTIVSDENIKRWFENVGEHLEQRNLLDLPASRVFTCDARAFLLAPELSARTDARTVERVTTFEGKQCLTVLFTMSAAGVLAPPMTVHKCIRISRDIAENNAEGWRMGKSLTGWMNGLLFYEYIANTFYKWLVEQDTKFPVILYLDGHALRVTLELSKFCESKGIVLVLLFPNAAHLMQPLDTAFFGPLKGSYKRAVIDWRMRNGGDRLKTNYVSNVLCDALKTLNLKETAATGFRECGLYPFKSNATNKEKILNAPQMEQTAESDQESRSDIAKKDFPAALRVLQSYLPTAALQKFTDCRDKVLWDGPAEYEEMFYFWRDIKQLNDNFEFSTEDTGNSVSDGSEETEEMKPFQIVQDRSLNESFSSLAQNLSLPESLDSVIKIEIPTVQDDFIEVYPEHQDNIVNIKSEVSTAAKETDKDEKPVLKFLKDNVFWPGDFSKKGQFAIPVTTKKE